MFIRPAKYQCNGISFIECWFGLVVYMLEFAKSLLYLEGKDGGDGKSMDDGGFGDDGFDDERHYWLSIVISKAPEED